MDLNLSHDTLDDTHEYITCLPATRDTMGEDWGHCTHLQVAYEQMQGERWSPHGEAKPILKRRGVFHTSMSIGDVLITPHGAIYEVVEYGFRLVGARLKRLP
jgi:hypothetical protein